MTVQHVAKILEVTTDMLTPGQRAAVLQMAYRADRRGTIRAGQMEIATDIGLSRKSVSVLYALLESGGLIQKDRPGRYRFDLDSLDLVESYLNQKG